MSKQLIVCRKFIRYWTIICSHLGLLKLFQLFLIFSAAINQSNISFLSMSPFELKSRMSKCLLKPVDFHICMQKLYMQRDLFWSKSENFPGQASPGSVVVAWIEIINPNRNFILKFLFFKKIRQFSYKFFCEKVLQKQLLKCQKY